MNLTFTDRVAFVSGAGRGIGKEIAISLAREGCTVICASKNPQSCGKAAEEIRAMGFKADSYALDISKREEIKKCADELSQKYGRMDIIVNNAGITRDNLMLRMSDEEWEDVIATNLSSAFYTVRYFVKTMMGNRWGRIVNIGSVTGVLGNTGQANYAAAKAGLIGYTKTLARELSSRNITANVIAPGFITTDMTSALSESITEQVKTVIPLKRFGTPEDIAGICTYLCSEEGGYITGQTISVNGGMSMQ
jgi:3-oxoacyl-(acyl-carrier-protein) reductase